MSVRGLSDLAAMSVDISDTIAALASPAGTAARGIVRVSGPDVSSAVLQVFQCDDGTLDAAGIRPLCHAGHVTVDEQTPPFVARLYHWPTGRSYTGQPMAEIHTIGSPPLLEALLAALFRAGVRPARPGEFTLRAFLAGRVDLLQAEAVLGVIDAADHTELQTALEQLAGGISNRIVHLRMELIELLADLEAGLDFADEDIEFIDSHTLLSRIEEARDFLEVLRGQAVTRMLSTEKPRVVLAGLPNAGKSTLFNRLAEDEHALVSDVRGTTRDYLQTDIHVEGLDVLLIDTAGWEETAHDPSREIDRLAQQLRGEQVQRADLIVWCTDCRLNAEEHLQEERLRQEALRQHPSLLHVQTKSDRIDVDSARHSAEDVLSVRHISAQTGAGIVELQREIHARLNAESRGQRHLIGSTAARCRESLDAACESLTRAYETAACSLGDELTAVEVREALAHLGRIVGAVYTDDLLDRIFSKFCIGK